MKKPKNYTFGMYTLLLVFAALGGYLIFHFYGDQMEGERPGLILVLFAICGFLLTSIFYEIGHIIFAKFAGYKIVAINILGFEIGRVENKAKVYWNSRYEDFVGESRVVPSKEKTNPVLYFMGGFITSLIFDAILIVLDICLWRDVPNVFFGVIVFVIISILMTIYCSLPLNIDSSTDGVSIRCIKKNGKDGFNKYSELRASLRNGAKLEGIKSLEFVDQLTCDYQFLAFNSAIYSDDYEGAEKIIDFVIENSDKVHVNHFDRIIPNKLLVLSNKLGKDEFLEFYNNSIDASSRTNINKLETLESCRAYLVIAGLFLDNETATNKAIKAYDHLIKKMLESGAKEQERNLGNKIIEKISNTHSDWTINW